MKPTLLDKRIQIVLFTFLLIYYCAAEDSNTRNTQAINISYTDVPDYGTSNNLFGIVEDVDPANIRSSIRR